MIANKGMIIMLYGTSTSGKSSVCRNLQKIGHKDKKWVHLKIDGTDLAFKRQERYSPARLLQFIKESEENNPEFREVQKTFSNEQIYHALMTEKLQIAEVEIPLLLESDIDTFQKALDLLVEKKNRQAVIIEKQPILKLRHLVGDLFDQTFILVHEEMFDHAIDNSKHNYPTIMDIVPHPERSGQFMIDLFLNHLKKRNYSCRTHVALIHCPIHTLSERMIERNHYALKNKEHDNIRNEPFPFRQYSQLFGATSIQGVNHLCELEREEAKRAMDPFCTSSLETDKIIKEIGFIASTTDKIFIDPKCSYDELYDVRTFTSIQIAECISQL